MSLISSPYGRRCLLLAAVLTASGLSAGAYLIFRPPPPPLPPDVELAGIDRRVVTAVRKADKKVREAPLSGPAWGRLGQALIANEIYPQGLTCLARAEELDPRNPRWPYLQAAINPRTNPRTEAKLRQAIPLCREDNILAPRLRLAEWLLDHGRPEEAEAEFRRSLEAAPNNPWGQLGLARVAVSRDDYPAALAALDTADGSPSVVRETLPAAYHALHAEVRQHMGIPAAAAGRTVRVFPKDPGPPDPLADEMAGMAVGLQAEIKRTDQFLKEGNVPAALDTLRELVQDYPDADLAWLYLGRALLAAGKAGEAEHAIRNAIRLSPKSAFAHVMLGNVLRQTGRAEEAIGCFRLALKCQPSFWPASVSLGETLEKAGDLEGAVTAFREGLRLAPHNPGVHASLGQLLARLGRNEEAVVAVRDAVSLDPEDAKMRKLLIEVETARKSPPKGP